MSNESNQFILYFAGAGTKGSSELKLELGCNQLYSQLNERHAIMKWVEYKKEHPDNKGRLFVDSGAYSAYTKGKVIDVDDYIKLINEIAPWVEIFAQVDKIPQVIGREPTEEELAAAPAQSWENYLYMIKKVKPEYRDKIMPVFHFQEDPKWLHNMLEYTHEDGSHIPYIGLAVSTVDGAEVRHQWLEMCFDIIKKSSNPNVKTHAFGMPALAVLEDFPLTSSDSTTWVIAASYGFIIVDKKTICVSDRRIHDNGNIWHQSIAVQEELDKKVQEFGFTLKELAEDSNKRQLFNIMSMKKWEDTYIRKEKPARKVALF